MKTRDLNRVYFIGIGGIGMSALARYFKHTGKQVAGYDRVSTSLTDSLAREGIPVHFQDDKDSIPIEFLDKDKVLVVYTPAIPVDHMELNFFKSNGFSLKKRSEILGLITEGKTALAVAGTHGKTTVSTMLAEILNQSGRGCNAFLGGISRNLNSNLLLGRDSDVYVLEADEFDRSFLQLYPQTALITSLDPDHLDIYGDFAKLKESFELFLSQVNKKGNVIIKKGLEIEIPSGLSSYTYHLTDQNADFYAKDIQRDGLNYHFNFVCPDKEYKNMELGVYGRINLENAIAALALAWINDAGEIEMRKGISGFRGVKRRFEVRIENEEHIYIDDYAHHPREIKAFLDSVKEALPGRELTGVFQPHLYSRTRDFAGEFAESLSVLDNVILLDIYPAREKPLPGISSSLILDKLTNKGDRILCTKKQLFKVLEERMPGVLLSMGAGDIDQLVEGMEGVLKS